MAAHRKLDQRRDVLYAGEFRKGALAAWLGGRPRLLLLRSYRTATVLIRKLIIAPIFDYERFHQPLKDERVLFGKSLSRGSGLEDCHVSAIRKRSYAENDSLHYEFVHHHPVARINGHDGIPTGTRRLRSCRVSDSSHAPSRGSERLCAKGKA